MWKLIDRFFDAIAKVLADNLCHNIELVEQHREARRASSLATQNSAEASAETRVALPRTGDAFPPVCQATFIA